VDRHLGPILQILQAFGSEEFYTPTGAEGWNHACPRFDLGHGEENNPPLNPLDALAMGIPTHFARMPYHRKVG
jgi:hypothetical protein